MKQNMIIILLTAVAVLLLVGLIENRIPPTAQAAIGSHDWKLASIFRAMIYLKRAPAFKYVQPIKRY